MRFRSDRLEELLQENRLSQSELARKIGTTQTTIWKLTTGERQGSKFIHRIAAELKTNPSYLMGETDDPTEMYKPPLSTGELIDELGLIPVREVDMSLGMGATFLDTHIPVTTRVQHFPRKWVRNFTKSPPNDLFFVHTVGDSMQPTLISGDIVLIDSRQRAVDHTDLIWAFEFGGMGMVKRIGAARGGQVQILSDNPAISTELANPDELHIIGRVVATFRKM